MRRPILLLSDLVEGVVDLLKRGQMLEPELEICQLAEQLPMVRQELAQRRVQKTYHYRDPVLLKKHVLRAAQADPLGSQGAGPARILGMVRIRPDFESPELVRPPQ